MAFASVALLTLGGGVACDGIVVGDEADEAGGVEPPVAEHVAPLEIITPYKWDSLRAESTLRFRCAPLGHA
jgi:hypothetical protein